MSDTLMPFFTVLINVYNYGRYIDAAIQSVLDQSLAHDQFEVIVIDDGSTDDTAERVARFGNAVSYYFQKNSGQAAAFNAGISLARGKYIAFLDADDVWCGNKLEYIKNFLESHSSVDLIYHELIQVDSFGNILGKLFMQKVDEIVYDPMSAFRNGKLRAGSPTSGIVCSRRILGQLYPVPLEYKICADSYLMVAAPFVADSIGFMSNALAHYRLHDSNGYNTYDEKSGGHTCRDDLLLWNRLKLDLQVIQTFALRYGVNLSSFCADTSYRLMIMESMYIRSQSGVVKALWFFIKSYNKWKLRPPLIMSYRFISILLRLIFGNKVFNAIAYKYVGSRIHNAIHTLIYSYDSQRTQSAHE